MKKILTTAILITVIIACPGKEKTDTGTGTPTLEEGEKVFKKYCILCHGSDGKLGINGAKDLTISKLTAEERETQVRKVKTP